ncbi:hypothetical protein EYZ11_000303 [Aspergillus tanneri]|uniref:Uncharacterized protein n=1 Tax=Aspergillus tanneri TaxID=1220188 RepID=A0A4S3JXJ6_9EURO|nr:hypothetical protein EYZ11_000303 [Aspergillus tanneri]
MLSKLSRFLLVGSIVKLMLNAHPGTTSKAINYPSIGGDSYGYSVQQSVRPLPTKSPVS